MKYTRREDYLQHWHTKHKGVRLHYVTRRRTLQSPEEGQLKLISESSLTNKTEPSEQEP